MYVVAKDVIHYLCELCTCYVCTWLDKIHVSTVYVALCNESCNSTACPRRYLAVVVVLLKYRKVAVFQYHCTCYNKHSFLAVDSAVRFNIRACASEGLHLYCLGNLVIKPICVFKVLEMSDGSFHVSTEGTVDNGCHFRTCQLTVCFYGVVIVSAEQFIVNCIGEGCVCPMVCIIVYKRGKVVCRNAR